MDKPLKTFRYSCGGIHYVAKARSMAEFIRMTGADRAYSSMTGNTEQIAIAERAEPDHYMAYSREANAWVQQVSKIKLAQIALDAARQRAAGNGNAPPIKIEKGETAKGMFNPSTIERFITVDGERRARWARMGSRYSLEDMTGHPIKAKRNWWDSDGKLLSHDYRDPMQVRIDPWNEACALANAVEAWEAGGLPPVTEQQSAAIRREAERAAANDRAGMLKRLEPHLDDLLRLLAQEDSPQAARLLSIIKGEAP